MEIETFAQDGTTQTMDAGSWPSTLELSSTCNGSARLTIL
jgi:hypothetical protein